MNTRNIAFVFSRLFAIYMFTEALHFLFLNARLLLVLEKDYSPILFVFVITYLVLTYILWFRAEWIVKRLIKDHGSQHDHYIDTSRIDLQIITFSAVGLFLLANSIPGIIESVINWYQSPEKLYGTPDFIRITIAPLTGNIVKTIIGLWLFFGSPSIVSLFKKSRNLGTVKWDRGEKKD